MRYRPFALLALVVFGLGVLALPASAESRSISMKDSYFATRYLVITVGDSVVWSNNGDLGHTVVAFDGSFSSSSSDTCDDGNPLTSEDCMDPGENFDRTFETVGTFDYFCKIHGNAETPPDPNAGATEQPCGMCARIKVIAKSSPKPVKTNTTNANPRRTPTKSPSPSVTPTPSKSATALPTVTTSPAGSGKGPGQGVVALAAILILAAAGFAVWRYYLAPR
jgi:plastocyanin